MFHYEALCYNCKKIFKVYEETPKYKLVKEKKTKFFCEDYDHQIRMEAIKNFFR
ncbi:DUF2197 domain-containing protein [Oceanobacillus jeddahense]|uniref:DUF2197 domain-containing protein n=1 Tax=Oceanobacillus jeddahense TaxID=1462527 RepID=UPI0009443CFC|nr:DUF2197 domain-containing protein [Oceanobacillus jeddahense]